MAINNSQVCEFAAELTATMPGTTVAFGPLLYNPVAIIFDNQSTGAVAIAVGGVTWRTFPTGEALVLDLRNQHGIAPNFTISVGTIFTATGAGTGPFSISYVYALNM